MSTTGPTRTPHFCRNCGAPLRPNVRFCHHCGTPIAAAVAAPAPAAVAAPAPAAVVAPTPAEVTAATPAVGVPAEPQVAAPAPVPGVPAEPAVAAPQWPQGKLLAGGATGPRRANLFAQLPPLGKLAVLFFGLVLIGGVIQSLLPSQPSCTYSCGVVTGPLQPSGRAFTASDFSFEYPPLFTQGRSVLGDTVSFSSNFGPVIIWSGQGHVSLTTVVQQSAQKITGFVQNLTDLGPIWGAEIGFVPGAGEFYSGVAETQSGQEVLVGVGIIAAQSGGIWAAMGVVTPCTNPANGAQRQCSEALLQSQQETFGASQDYDSILSHWHWG